MCCQGVHQETLPSFSSSSFAILGLTFKYLILFELIFVSGIRRGSSFILPHVVPRFPTAVYLVEAALSFSLPGSPVQY